MRESELASARAPLAGTKKLHTSRRRREGALVALKQIRTLYLDFALFALVDGWRTRVDKALVLSTALASTAGEHVAPELLFCEKVAAVAIRAHELPALLFFLLFVLVLVGIAGLSKPPRRRRQRLSSSIAFSLLLLPQLPPFFPSVDRHRLGYGH